ncbi:MAG TPA: hypothetical protein VFY23_11995 [Candidatus Limnocylindrales bacterium]|nr:hypothetical protein [Candidatus Limnocylindrales bacterium]
MAAPRLRPDELTAGVLDGGLDGWLVYADATLEGACRPNGLAPCGEGIPFAIPGIALEVVRGAGTAGTVVGAPPDRAVLVLRVRGPRLEYLGSLIVDPDGSPSLDDLTVEVRSPSGPVRQTLWDVRGWLVVKPACVSPGGGTAACDRPPFLADDPPLADGILRSDRGDIVDLAPDLWGVDPATGTVSAGPFLVRRTGSGEVGWAVVARYDPERSVRVVVP